MGVKELARVALREMTESRDQWRRVAEELRKRLEVIREELRVRAQVMNTGKQDKG